ncbi:GIY-YIG nuclease family protein [Patescibacteria group bacterium]|nr:GIY-YIG nuclease family protein [Patescibacteria group bacterium]
MKKLYSVYILANKRNTVLYVGLTSNLVRRVREHKKKYIKGFTKKYNVEKLIYYEVFDGPKTAITREKTIKGWVRRKKINLIRGKNPGLSDLYDTII